MKPSITLLLLVFVVSISNAQTQFIQNAGFETWGQQEVQGISGPEFIYAPDSWYPFGDLFTYLLGQDDDFNLYESSDAQSGLKSAELLPDSVNTYADIVSFIPSGDQPAALHGYYKMDSNTGIHYAYCSLCLTPLSTHRLFRMPTVRFLLRNLLSIGQSSLPH